MNKNRSLFLFHVKSRCGCMTVPVTWDPVSSILLRLPQIVFLFLMVQAGAMAATSVLKCITRKGTLHPFRTPPPQKLCSVGISLANTRSCWLLISAREAAKCGLPLSGGRAAQLTMGTSRHLEGERDWRENVSLLWHSIFSPVSLGSKLRIPDFLLRSPQS